MIENKAGSREHDIPIQMGHLGSQIEVYSKQLIDLEQRLLPILTMASPEPPKEKRLTSSSSTQLGGIVADLTQKLSELNELLHHIIERIEV